jgi:glycosyltransferase involved in cell wall biosynthesis
MKLLLYSHFFVPSVGGVESIVLSLAQGLARVHHPKGPREFDVTLVTETPAGNYDDSALPFAVVRQPGLFRLWRLMRSSHIVHVAGPALAPMILGLLAGKPVVVEHHGFQTICPNGQLFIEPQGAPCPGHFMAERHDVCLRCNSCQGWFFSWRLWVLTFVRRFLCAQAYANIAPTHWLSGLLKLPRVIAIPHGLGAGQPISRNAPQSGDPVIVFMGRLVTTKGVGVLLKAAKILWDQDRHFELLIIGDGPERVRLEQFARDSQLAHPIRFAGRLEDDQLDSALAHAAVVVVPSLGGEVFGMVIAENMVRGLPVVASDLGAFVEVLGESGLTFHTGDSVDLASHLARLLDDPADAKRLGRLARQRAGDFCDRGRMIEGHSRVYQAAFDMARH